MFQALIRHYDHNDCAAAAGDPKHPLYPYMQEALPRCGSMREKAAERCKGWYWFSSAEPVGPFTSASQAFAEAEEVAESYMALQRPGKFANCEPWALYFYDTWGVGGSDRTTCLNSMTLGAVCECETTFEREGVGCSPDVSWFEVSHRDRAAFPQVIPAGVKWLGFWEDDNGFIYTLTSTDGEPS